MEPRFGTPVEAPSPMQSRKACGPAGAAETDGAAGSQLPAAATAQTGSRSRNRGRGPVAGGLLVGTAVRLRPFREKDSQTG